MATFYLDYDGGNDANDGTTFANRWKTFTNGATAARINAGDTIRIMASPDPTSLGTGAWNGSGRPGLINISSSTNATPIVITTSSAHGLSTGDYVTILSHSTNTNANGVWKVGTTPTTTTFQILQMDGSNTTGNGVGSSGLVTKANNLVVKLSTAANKNIALCGGLGQKPAWTQSTNVTATQFTSTWKEGYSCAQIAIADAFTTGKAAYYALPASLDLSAYQQVSFWIRQSAGTIGAAGSVYVALCTDTTGDTVAHTCNVPLLGGLNQWSPIVVNLATNLNAAIQSVAFYVVTDNGAQTFQLDNIVAVKAASSADSVNLTSLISKSDGTGDEGWYPIQSINNDVLMIGTSTDLTSTDTNIRGYYGTTESVTTYKRETTKIAMLSSGATASTINKDGAAGSLITFSGGWNRTDMSTQTGQTWYDGQNNNGNGIVLSSKSYIALDRVNVCRYYQGISGQSSNYISYGNLYATACGYAGLYLTGNNFTATALWANNNSIGMVFSSSGISITDIKLASNNWGSYTSGVSFSNAYNTIVSNSFTANNNVGIGLLFSASSYVQVNNAVANNNSVNGIISSSSNNCSVTGGSTTGNSSGGVAISTGGILNLNNFTINESTEVTSITLGAGTVYSNRHDNTDNNSWIWQGQGTINQQASIVDSPATTAWKMSPTTVNTTATTPVFFKIGTIVCAANKLVTVTVRMRRSNTGLTMRLVCPGGQISGVATDVTSSMTAAADTWETVTITFTPTKAGGVNIFAQAYGGTTYSGYVCNLTASQA